MEKSEIATIAREFLKSKGVPIPSAFHIFLIPEAGLWEVAGYIYFSLHIDDATGQVIPKILPGGD